MRMREYDFVTQSLKLESIPNARDLGGYVLPDGRTVKPGLLLRGGSLSNATDGDIECLAGRYHVAKVFDFRTSIERNLQPDREIPGSRNIWMPAFDENSQSMEMLSLPQEAYRNLGPWLLEHASEPHVQEVAAAMYTSMVCNEFTQIQYAGFLQNIIATPEGAVYWHCSQGKDRTGVGAAVLLAALGADRELIMQDYAISAQYYAEELAPYLEKVPTEGEKAVLTTFISVNCEYFEKALDWIDSEFGSMEGFLRGPLCLGDDDFEILRSRYLEKR